MKRALKILYVVFFLCLIIGTKSEASVKLTGIENFPKSYQPYLYELKKKYPNWVFTALYTGLDWNTVIENEYANDKNLVPLSYSNNWKCYDNGKYNVEIDIGWVNASRWAIEYTMDPRNFLNEVRIFQFEKLSYDNTVNSKTGVEKILYGTEFYNRKVTYKDAGVTPITMNEKYSDLIWDAGVYSGVSPYHLASRIKQEVGPFVTHSSISGTVSGYEGLYNFYNIGATSSTEDLGAIKNGLRYAWDAHGASEEVKQNYLIPWTNPDKAITGGAVFIGSSYISVGQNNLYLQKFDVNDDRGNDLFWHQYMTNCLAPYSESNSIYKAYSNMGMMNSSIGFVIPIYENMPTEPIGSPSIATYDYINDGKKVYANVTTTLNIRSGPGTSYELLTSVTSSDIMTRLRKGVQSGERWDKVKLENGIIGYAFQTYIVELIEETPVPSTSPTPSVLPTQTIMPTFTATATLTPSLFPTITPTSTPTPTPKQTPIVLPEEGIISFNESLDVNENRISNIENKTVLDIKSLIKTELDMEFLSNNDEPLVDGDLIGTGSKIKIKDSEIQEEYEYIFILYGDVNGDSEINPLDALLVQKHILEIKLLEGANLIAGNTLKNGEEPSPLDVLRLQKHILEIKFIEQ